MGYTKRTYSKTLRDRMRPGDIIAFGGKSQFSEAIKWFTRSVVSHVAIVLQTRRVDTKKPGYFNQIIESTARDGKYGVMISRLSCTLSQYEGEIWWLPLADHVRNKLDQDRYFDWLMNMEGRPYDVTQAVLSAVDVFGGLTENREDYEKLFCSELAAGALKAGGVIPVSVNPAEVTPQDLVSWKIYADNYVQLKGERCLIKHYNSRPVDSV
ncbi:MAG: hypothetical protein D6704_10775 [Nitrospirae bacterium]|nr:MAG: hypothetical protein D6704_10775 [Nitrospirota bacterium]